MKRIITSIFILASINAFAQTEQLTKEDLAKELQSLKSSIQTLQKENSSLKTEIIHLNSKLSIANKSIDSLRNKIEENSYAIAQTANQLGIKITTTEQIANKRIDEVGQLLSRNSLYGIIGVLSAILLSVLLYWFLSKRQKIDKSELIGKLFATKTELLPDTTKLNNQLLELIEKHLKVIDNLNGGDKPPIDHTFHKNSANELMRIINYANSLDPESQEAIALKGSIGRLINYFNVNHYEVIDFTGKDFDERIPMDVRESIFDENIPNGKEIIIKTLKPQIKYKGEIIQDPVVIVKYNNI